MDKITEFQGEYRFLSNFWPWDGNRLLAEPLKLEYEGLIYPSVEHAYQASKCLNYRDRAVMAACYTAGDAKRYGRKIVLPKNWEEVKLRVILELVRLKFAIPGLRAKLLATGDAELIEGNCWGDRFWGVCKGVGENHLGKILMHVRSEARGSQV